MSTPHPTVRSLSSLDILSGIISISKRILSAHSRHFLALSVLFLLPLSSLLLSLPSLLQLFFNNPNKPPSQSLLRSSSFTSTPLLITSIYTLSLVLLTLSASATITLSLHNGFFGRPVKLLPTLQSLPSSLLRLFPTLLCSLILPLTLSSLLLSSLPLPITLSLLAAFTSYFTITYSLAFPISVLESTYAFTPLRRSATLITGLLSVIIPMYLFFIGALSFVLWGFSLGDTGTSFLPLVARTVFGSAVTTVLILHWMVMNAVLYMYCKAVHGELEMEIAREFAWDYVCLPFDDEKVPHVVSVVRL